MNGRRGQDLIKQVTDTETDAGRAVLWWLGQHSFILKLAGVTVYIDPFLSDHGKRRIPPFLSPEDITNADIIIGTHDHRDHIDREVWPTLAAASPSALFVVPDIHRHSLMREQHIAAERLLGIDDGVTLQAAGLSIHGIPAAHEFLHRDAETGQCPFMGVIVERDGCAVYHAGDTCLYDGMLDRLRGRDLRAALLPINGRDAERLSRQCIGNMTFQEAADLAGFLEPGLTLPAHFDMFLGNMEDPRRFTDYMQVKYPNLRAMIPEYTQPIEI